VTCADAQKRLTAYVDGELDDATGSAVRGHLRTCAACRAAADDELAVRDAVGKLPAPDVPGALWSQIADRLAAEEVADSKRSRWWLWWQTARPRLVPALLVAGAATLAIAYVVKQRASREEQIASPPAPPAPVTPAGPEIRDLAVRPSMALDCDLGARVPEDAAAAVSGRPAAIERCYQAAADELLAMVATDRAGWPQRRAAEFDAELEAAQAAVATAAAGRPRERAWRAVIRLLQRAVTIPVVAEVTP
jgi:hypothetical protein